MRRRSAGYIIVSTMAVWASIAIATWSLWPVYETPAFVVVIAVALAAGTLVAIPAALLRWPSPVVLLLTVLVFLAVGVPAAVPDKAVSGFLPTLEGVIDLVAGVALGWRQLLTISIPVGDYQALLVPVLVLVLVGTVVALSFALRAKRAELAVLVPLGVFGLGVAFGPGVQTRPVEVPIALLVVELLWLVWFRWQRRAVAIRALSEASGLAGAIVGRGRRPLLARCGCHPCRRLGVRSRCRARAAAGRRAHGAADHDRDPVRSA